MDEALWRFVDMVAAEMGQEDTASSVIEAWVREKKAERMKVA